ncbi:MAG TPA: transposase [Syntrophorhabdaceae bacterium]|jgi:transposase
MNTHEDNRLKEFRQLKSLIRGSKEYLVVGIDIAKEKHHAFLGTAAGKTLRKQLAFTNTREGFESLCFHVEAVRRQNGLTKVVFGLEPTGDYHKPLAEYLLRQGHTLVMESGAAVKKT